LHPDLAALPVIGDGKNFLPTIHVKDLARFVVFLADETAKKFQKQYLIAVDCCQES
jgi:nucleoside-diphosphate-sugar epimerase